MNRVLGAAALAVILVGPTSAVHAGAGQPDPLEDARKAAAQTPFSGRVTLQWRQGNVLREEHLAVRGSHGAVLVDGRRSVMAVGAERLVYYPGQGWTELWPSGLVAASGPSLENSYEIRDLGYGRVAGYDTRVTEMRKNGLVRERIELEVATHLMLSRQEFDRSGMVERGFAFEEVRLPDPAVPALAVPASPKRDDPEPVRLSQLSAVDRGSDRLAAGYQRVGVYRQGGTVQILYSDGLYDLSLFQQDGGLDSGDLPSPRQTVRLAGHPAWTYSWPGGEGITWTAGHTVYTLMGDVPPDELRTVAGSVSVHRSTSVAHRLRQACRALVESFRGGR